MTPRRSRRLAGGALACAALAAVAGCSGTSKHEELCAGGGGEVWYLSAARAWRGEGFQRIEGIEDVVAFRGAIAIDAEGKVWHVSDGTLTRKPSVEAYPGAVAADAVELYWHPGEPPESLAAVLHANGAVSLMAPGASATGVSGLVNVQAVADSPTAVYGLNADGVVMISRYITELDGRHVDGFYGAAEPMNLGAPVVDIAAGFRQGQADSLYVVFASGRLGRVTLADNADAPPTVELVSGIYDAHRVEWENVVIAHTGDGVVRVEYGDDGTYTVDTVWTEPAQDVVAAPWRESDDGLLVLDEQGVLRTIPLGPRTDAGTGGTKSPDATVELTVPGVAAASVVADSSGGGGGLVIACAAAGT